MKLPWQDPKLHPIMDCPQYMSWSLNVVNFHFTLSSRAHQLHIGFLFSPWYNLQMIIKGPHIFFNGHGFGSVCKMPLSRILAKIACVNISNPIYYI